jgi:hypothetical protein
MHLLHNHLLGSLIKTGNEGIFPFLLSTTYHKINFHHIQMWKTYLGLLLLTLRLLGPLYLHLSLLLHHPFEHVLVVLFFHAPLVGRLFAFRIRAAVVPRMPQKNIRQFSPLGHGDALLALGALRSLRLLRFRPRLDPFPLASVLPTNHKL